MFKEIPGFNNYKIDSYGRIINKKGDLLSKTSFKNSSYVRLYRNGKRHTLAIDKLLYDLYGGVSSTIELYPNELAFQYNDTYYYITNQCRVYNAKRKQFIRTVIKNGYPVFTYYHNGAYKTVSLLSFLKNVGGDI